MAGEDGGISIEAAAETFGVRRDLGVGCDERVVLRFEIGGVAGSVSGADVIGREFQETSAGCDIEHGVEEPAVLRNDVEPRAEAGR